MWKLLKLPRLKRKKTLREKDVLDVITIMDENKRILLKKSMEILRYCTKKFKNHTPFMKTFYWYSSDFNKDNYNNFYLRLERNENGDFVIDILRWKPDEDGSYFKRQLFASIPVKVVISDNWKELCKKEYLKKKNEYEIRKLKYEKLEKIRKEKEELELFLKLKEKFGTGDIKDGLDK